MTTVETQEPQTEQTAQPGPAPRVPRLPQRGKRPARRRAVPQGISSNLDLLAPLLLLAAAAGALLLTFARPLTQTVVVGGAGDRAATVNFHDPELTPAGEPYRWTRDDSTLVFHAAGLAFPANRSVAFVARLAASRPDPAAAVRVWVRVNDSAVGQQQVTGEARLEQSLGIGYPGYSRGDAIDTRVTLLAETFTPPGDRRALGVAVLGPARLVEEPGEGPALPSNGAWWRWLGLALAGYGVALGLRRRPDVALLAGIALVLAMTGAALAQRAHFWRLMHLPLLALAVALPFVWRRDLIAMAGRVVEAARRRLGMTPPALALTGLAPAVGGQILLTEHQAPLLALALYAVGGALVLAALGAGGATVPPDEADADAAGEPVAPTGGWSLARVPFRFWPAPLNRGELVGLAAVLAVAAAARFWRLHDVPFALWRDEARHGLEALRILNDPTYRPIYSPNISLPGLYPTLLAGDFWLFGPSTLALRGLTAVAGVGAVAALYAVVRRLWSPREALVAAFLMAIGSWRVSLDRLAFDTAPTTLCTLLAFYFFLRGVDDLRAGRRGLPAFAGAGLAAALAAYGYYPGRFAALVLAAAALVLAIRERGAFLRRAWPGLALAAAIGAAALVPLASYAVEQPDLFFKRSEQAYLLSSQQLQGQTALQAVERNVAKHLVMFNWQGEPNARHHAPNWPLLDGVTALCFVLGLALAVIGVLGGRFRALFPLLWLAILLLPSIISIDAPSATRAQDAAPAAYALAALGLMALWRLLAGAESPGLVRRVLPTVAGVALALAAVYNYWLYFLLMPGDPRVLEKFQYVGETRAGYAIAEARAREPETVAYVPGAYLNDETLRFASGDAPLRAIPLEGGLPDGPALLVVPRGDPEEFARQLGYARQLAARAGLREVVGEPPPGGGQPTYVAFVRDGP